MIDPLNVSVPLSGVDTSLPLLPEGDYPVQVVESTIDANKDKTGLNWNLKLALTSPAASVDGREVKVDFPVFAVYALQARDDSKDVEAFKRSLGEAVDAIFGTNMDDRPTFTADLVKQAIGKAVIAQVTINEWQGAKNNKVRRLKKLAA
jgi:hypothetical protein